MSGDRGDWVVGVRPAHPRPGVDCWVEINDPERARTVLELLGSATVAVTGYEPRLVLGPGLDGRQLAYSLDLDWVARNGRLDRLAEWTRDRFYPATPVDVVASRIARDGFPVLAAGTTLRVLPASNSAAWIGPDT